MYLRNAEPSLHELLSDPVMHLLMARDGLSVNAGWNLTRFARGRRLESDPPSLRPGWGAPHPGRRAVQDFSFGLARMPARRLSFSR